MIIRDAQREDIVKSVLLGEQFASQAGVPFSPEHFTQRLLALHELGVLLFIIAEKSGTILGGIAGVCAQSLFADFYTVEELFWYVGKEWRGGGIGKKLFAAFIHQAQGRKARYVYMVDLETGDNVSEQYRKANFVKLESKWVLSL